MFDTIRQQLHHGQQSLIHLEAMFDCSFLKNTNALPDHFRYDISAGRVRLRKQAQPVRQRVVVTTSIRIQALVEIPQFARTDCQGLVYIGSNSLTMADAGGPRCAAKFHVCSTREWVGLARR